MYACVYVSLSVYVCMCVSVSCMSVYVKKIVEPAN